MAEDLGFQAIRSIADTDDVQCSVSKEYPSGAEQKIHRVAGQNLNFEFPEDHYYILICWFVHDQLSDIDMLDLVLFTDEKVPARLQLVINTFDDMAMPLLATNTILNI